MQKIKKNTQIPPNNLLIINESLKMIKLFPQPRPPFFSPEGKIIFLL
jgi:hypothetical protein